MNKNESFTHQPNEDPIENFCFSIIQKKNEDEIQLNERKVEEMRSEMLHEELHHSLSVYIKTMNK